MIPVELPSRADKGLINGALPGLCLGESGLYAVAGLTTGVRGLFKGVVGLFEGVVGLLEGVDALFKGVVGLFKGVTGLVGVGEEGVVSVLSESGSSSTPSKQMS
jgi:hypothetical protein